MGQHGQLVLIDIISNFNKFNINTMHLIYYVIYKIKIV